MVFYNCSWWFCVPFLLFSRLPRTFCVVAVLCCFVLFCVCSLAVSVALSCAVVFCFSSVLLCACSSFCVVLCLFCIVLCLSHFAMSLYVSILCLAATVLIYFLLFCICSVCSVLSMCCVLMSFSVSVLRSDMITCLLYPLSACSLGCVCSLTFAD